jgi:hypothetical protein
VVARHIVGVRLADAPPPPAAVPLRPLPLATAPYLAALCCAPVLSVLPVLLVILVRQRREGRVSLDASLIVCFEVRLELCFEVRFVV